MWWYGAIHVLVSFTGFKTRDAICSHLCLSSEIADDVLNFLVSRGLVTERKGAYDIGKTRIHLGSKSPLIARHHANWRMKSIESLEQPRADDLHYSALIALSRKDAKRVRNMILEFLQATEGILMKTNEEAPFVLALDLFEF